MKCLFFSPKSTHLRGGVLHQFYVNQQSKMLKKWEEVSSLQQASFLGLLWDWDRAEVNPPTVVTLLSA